jgi:c-di-GMP-binding flagellar brake protein YcgR
VENNVFEVGMTLSIETYYKSHLKTQIIGWKKNAFVLSDAIYVYGKPAEMRSNDSCKIRFLKDGNAYGFEAKVITVQFFPFPLMFLSYPDKDKIECVKVRVAPRFKADLPVTFLDASGAVVSEAIMLDISEGGCELKGPVQKDRNFVPETDYSIKFKLMDKELSIGCKIKKIVEQNEMYSLGMEFVNVTPVNKEILNMFLDFLNKHAAR